MIFDSWTDKIVWKWKVKQISKRRAQGVMPSQDEWNLLAKPYLRQAQEDIRKNCPYEKMLRERGE